MAWPAAEVARILDRVRDTRLLPPPAHVGEGDWRFGVAPGFLRRLQRWWASGYDPAAAQARLNRHPQYRAAIDGLAIHFVHVAGENPGARPLLLTHGWPGSHAEFAAVIGPLAFPSRHGGRAEQAFDLVIPSLPGFGFSGKPAGLVGQRETARRWDRLMTEVLGFPRYLAQGGDFGALVTTWLGTDYPERCVAIHLNMLNLLQPDPPADDAEARWQATLKRGERPLNGYSRLQRWKPQSIGWATADHPLGQAAWIVERFHDWTDVGDRALDDVFAMDDLVTNAMIYVTTDSLASSAYYYHARAEEHRALGGAYPRCRAPAAFAAFPGDPLSPVPPRSRAEAMYDIVRWTEMPRGGHFAALQEPALFAADVRAWGDAVAPLLRG